MSKATTAEDEGIPQELLNRVQLLIRELEAPSVESSSGLAVPAPEDRHTLGILREESEIGEENDDEEYSPPSSIASSPCSSPRQGESGLPEEIEDESLGPLIDDSLALHPDSGSANTLHVPQSSSGGSERTSGTPKPANDRSERNVVVGLSPNLMSEDSVGTSYSSFTTTSEELHPWDSSFRDPKRASEAFSILTRSSASTIKAIPSIVTTTTGLKEVYKARPRALKQDHVVVIKICWLEDRFTIAVPASIDLERLLQRVRKKIRMCGHKDIDKPIRLRYIDDEGDEVSLLTGEDLWLAFDLSSKQSGDITRITLIAYI